MSYRLSYPPLNSAEGAPDAFLISQAAAEIIARDVIRAVRSGKQDRPTLPKEKSFRVAGEMVLKAYSRHWKPVTCEASQRCFRDYLLPCSDGWFCPFA